MGWRAAVLAMAFVVAGCNQDQQQSQNASYEAHEQAVAGDLERGLQANEAVVAGMASSSDQPASGEAPPAPPPPPVAEPVPAQPTPTQPPQGPAPVAYLAYSYQRGLKLPGDHLIGVMDAHVRVCQQAGPRLCQLISSNRSGDPESYLSGTVQLRGEPSWLRHFMDGLEHEADAAGGQIVSQSTTTEDLTRSIVDTEATLRAKKTLRDRLQSLLANRPGRLSDLLEAERALADVQGEIDSIQSNLAVMQTRVAMSELTLSYESEAQPLRSDLFEPLTEAFANFFGWIVKGFAAIITFIAMAAPWALVIGLALWLTRKWRAKRRGWFWRKRAETPAPTDPV